MYANAYLAQRKALPRPTLTQTLILALTLALALSRQRKAQLRVLLNDTGLAAQLTSWRRPRATTPPSRRTARYGFKYHEESAAILGSTGPGMGGPMRLRV